MIFTSSINNKIKEWKNNIKKYDNHSREEIEKSIYDLYKNLNFKQPQVIITSSPVKGIIRYLEYCKNVKILLIENKINIEQELIQKQGKDWFNYIKERTSSNNNYINNYLDNIKKAIDKFILYIPDEYKTNNKIPIFGGIYSNNYCLYNLINEYNLTNDYSFLIRSFINLSNISEFWWLTEKIAIVSEKPIFISVNEQNVLHNTNKAALEYKDKFRICVWNGTQVPLEIIESQENITLEKIQDQNNLQIRYIMMELYGMARLLIETKAYIEHQDNFGTLVSTDILRKLLNEHTIPAKFVIVKDPSTNNQYALRVPNEINTAKEGVAWTFKQTTKTYVPSKET